MTLFSIHSSVENAFTVFFAWLPRLAGALAVLLIGYLVAKLVAKLIWRGLQRAGLDRTLHSGQAGNFVQKLTRSPSHLIGRLAFWAIFLGAVSLAAAVLGIAALTAFVGAVCAYLPNVVAAFLIFLVAGAIAAGVAGLVGRTMGDTPLGKIVAAAVPVIVMSIAVMLVHTYYGYNAHGGPVGVGIAVFMANRASPGASDHQGLLRIRVVAKRAEGVPFAGFHTLGEIARTRGVEGFHNQTLVVLALS